MKPNSKPIPQPPPRGRLGNLLKEAGASLARWSLLIALGICATSAAFAIDTDGDGVDDSIDLDADNDGILNSVEGACASGAGALLDKTGITVSKDAAITYTLNGAGLPGLVDGADGSNYVIWNPTGTLAGKVWLQFSLPTAQALDLIELGHYPGQYLFSTSSTYSIQASNDGTTWTTLVASQTYTNTTPVYASNNSAKFDMAGNTVAYKYYRILGISGSAGNGWAQEAYFHRSVCSRDTDGDGIPDYLDTDSDGDGAPDAREASPAFTAAQVNSQGRLIGGVNANGIPLVAGTSGSQIGYSQDSSVNATIDTDGDGVADAFDLDDDNDGILDTLEVCSQGGGREWTFNNGNDGWTENDAGVSQAVYTDGTICSNVTSQVASDHTGYIGGFDNKGGDTYFLSPDSLNLNLSAGNNPALTFRWYGGIVGSSYGTVSYPVMVTLKSGSSTLSCSLAQGNWTQGVWQTFSVPITTSNFGSGLTQQFLSDIDQIWIQVEPYGAGTLPDCSNGSEFFLLDNVKIDGACVSASNDVDGDGIPNSLDTDSDGDGCPDAIEGGGSFTTANVDANGRLTGGVDANGIPIVAGSSGQTLGDSQNASVSTQCPLDTDGDGVPDIVDLDDDNDGILDSSESGCVNEINLTEGLVAGRYSKDYWLNTKGIRLETVDQNFNSINGTFSVINHAPWGGSSSSDPDTYMIYSNPDLTPDMNGTVISFWNGTTKITHESVSFWTDPQQSNNPSRVVIFDINGNKVYDKTFIADGHQKWTFGPAETNGSKIHQLVFFHNATLANTAAIDMISYCDLADTDGDGIVNSLDTDSDGDGCPDAIEGSGSFTTANVDANGRLTGGVDANGVPIVAGSSGQTLGDSQNAAVNTQCLPPLDTDGDGVPNSVDLDDDNDGIPDTVEAATAINGGDTDGDGIIDSLDLDSDNDGIPDVVEARNLTTAQIAALDANKDGRLDGAVGTDGIPDVVQATANAGTVNYTPLDTDGDSHPDFQDLDSDNDSINDVREANGTDANGDGKADGTPGTNGIPTSVPAGGLTPPDTDGDGKPDFRDLDTDNDGINDVSENGGADPDNNGIAGTGQVPTDTDGDGIADVVDGSPTSFGDSNDATPRNSDNDPIPNFRDLDSDNDTISDVIEGGNGPADTNKDGTISPGESPDGDGDGIPNAVDNNPGTFGDAGNPALPNADGDGNPDYIDVDSDNDGTFDICELTTRCALDADGDGMVDNPSDPDGDGIPNNGGNDTVPGGFGGSSAPVAPLDSDGDGVPDSLDLDDDNDGIPDTVEALTAINGGDTDGDGIPDTLDLDSDNDGILDFVEARNLTAAQMATLDANHDGRLDGAVGTDGIPDVVQSSPNSGIVNFTPLDTDGDSRPDFQDLDSDNDGINDVREANGTDANGDGLLDTPVAGGLSPVDTDGDGKPDFRDLDTDNDGINDVIENGGVDPDNNGITGTGQVPLDSDSDGIPDTADARPNLFGDNADPAPQNSDNDSVPNFRDLDSDNDTIGDVIEGGNGPADTNNDGFISPADTNGGDTDGDGIPNVIDNNPATFGDAGNPALPEQGGADTDLIPDYIDVDSNGDGNKDICQSTINCGLDANGDGMVDTPSDPDGDGIPNNGGVDTLPGSFGGLGAPTAPVDSDGDGVPDNVDLDDDNDGIPDTVEALTALNGGDTDGDGIIDSLDLDSDGDGLPDFVEARNLNAIEVGLLDANNDGRLDGAVGTDGIPNVVQGSPNSGLVNYTPLDTDGDSRPDFQDLDSDNDGINDVREASGTDANGDGKADGTVGTNGIASGVPAGGLDPVDTDGDGHPDFRDLDTDNDGINDVVEAGLADPDNNGIAGTGQIPSDTDQDGIPNSVDGTPSVYGDGADPAPLNSDNDSVPNFRDLDSDNDTISDVIEGGNGPADTNGDGTVNDQDSSGVDNDGDGIPNILDNAPSVYGDAGNAPLPNPDGDGLPSYIDVDSDGNGTKDICQLSSNCALDGNGDGMVDTPSDPDGDGIPNNGGVDSIPGSFGGIPAPTPPSDSDGDGIPNSVDLDDDNDGIPDTVEQANALNGGDTDGDGIIDSLDLDSDGDGIYDLYEARVLTPVQLGNQDANHDGRLDGPVGTDGIPDIVQTSPNAGVANFTPKDFDGDGRPDYVDLDSDNDSINDVREADGVDANGDGRQDGTVGGSGVAGSALSPTDTDGDGNPDFRDLDSDNDGINDVRENGGTDADNNGVADGTDADGDGILSTADRTPNVWGESGDLPAPNADNDNVPNYRDLDSDNDTIADVIEGGNASKDTNDDGYISSLDANGSDTDGDGIPDAVDNSPGVYGDAGNPLLPEQGGADTDTIPDYLDLDSDGDGLWDIQESTGNAAYDANRDGMVDNPQDLENDGIANIGGIDGAPNTYGDLHAPDTDGDGIPDSVDLDDDNDGIPDTVEIATSINQDTDGDGILDYKDLDSDNDGILDIYESGRTTGADLDGDGRLDGTVGSDGIPDVVQATPNAGVINYPIVDTDGDGRPDFQDLDSDNDGISDVRESNGTDANGDGKADGAITPDGVPGTVPVGGSPRVDTDGDGKPDFRDLDSDNDGINDVTEYGGTDSNNDGLADGTDTDRDGIPSTADGQPGTWGDVNDPTPLNSDNDPVPDFRDLDSDNDTIGDVVEGGNGAADTNNDGFISPLDTNGGDTDGDGIPNVLDNNPGVYGDAGNPPVPDTDGDGYPNYRDVDSDGNGTKDICQLGSKCALDGNGDGMVDTPADPDGDGIPNNGGVDGAPGGFGGLPAASAPVDSDNDGVPDTTDLDDDNDGIPDTVENANAINGGDTDGDGIPDRLDLDSDGDGIPDVIEAGHGGVDANKDGRIDTPAGANGLPDIVETTLESGMTNYTPRDTDGDGRPDYVDLDSDNDSISDLLESGNGGLVDLDHDGVADGTPGANGMVPTAGLVPPVDTDGDGKPDYRDVDSNGDGVPDIVDNGFINLDANGDGMVDNPSDPEGDGIPNIVDTKDGNFGGFPLAGCAAWSLQNPVDTDGDVFPSVQEYVFGGSPLKGDHLVVGTTRRQGLTIAKNATGGVDISYVRPQGRYDAEVTLFGSVDLNTWAPVTALPTVISNGDGTDTVKWVNVQTHAPLTTDRGFVRLHVATPCDPVGKSTLVQGWSRETVTGTRQTYGVNFTSMPVYTGVVDSASGSTLTLNTSGGGTNLGSLLTSPGSYYIEFTDGAAEGQRIDLASGAVNSVTLNLASTNNTTASLPGGVAGSHFVIRKHRTLGEIFPSSEWRGASTIGSADQVLVWNGNGYDTYWNSSVFASWVQQSTAGLAIRNSLVIPPGAAVFVVHADVNGVNQMLQIGDVRYNDFVRPLVKGSTGLNFVANGYPLDTTPAAWLMTSGRGFTAASSVGSADQIQNWNGDTTVNATGMSTSFLLSLDGSWRRQGTLAMVTNSLLFNADRGTFVKVLADKPTWTHPQPWNAQPWVQP